MLKTITGALLGVFALGCGAQAFEAGDAAKGEANFRQCQACHAVGPTAKNKVGPQLNGIVGRQIGTAEGYNYGKATAAKGADGTTWTEDMLFEYLVNPAEFVGGPSKMPMKFPDETFRRDVITYLAQFDASGEKK